MEFKKFLEKSRKGNGEKFLPRSIALYNRFIEINSVELEKRKDNVEELIEYMNSLIVNYHNPTLRASFRMYLLFLGLDEDDDRLKKLKSPKKRATALSSLRMLGDKVIPRQDLKFLYDKVEDEWKLIIGVLYDTACRESELLGIKWRDIKFYDKPDGVISAEVRVLGKGGKYGTVFLTEPTVKLLKKLRPNIEEDDLVFVFRMKDGKPYKRQDKAILEGFRKRTQNILGKAYTVHSTRHSKLTHLSENSCDILAVSSIARHQNISTTTIYSKMSRKIAETGYKNHTQMIGDD